MVRFLICPRLGQALSGPMYFRCELVEAGGLMSCGTSTAESYRQHLNAWRPQFYDMDFSSMNLRHH
jgi:hypothetical protein